ncbi:MAG TPA: MgtC/SapB family protein, partial [Clostridia bacterium]|nr:MgtC/SapB family protein [Clostridia bacterium]
STEYILNKFGTGDPMRLGAQVISGIGFLGAGTIVVTGRNHVVGLTTAAGLWASACIGIAAGIGFFQGAILGFILMFAAFTIFHRIENYLYRHSSIMEAYAELANIEHISSLINKARELGLILSHLEISKNNLSNGSAVAVKFTIKSESRKPHAEIIRMLGNCEGIEHIEEIN